ncbi:MAG: beta family protein [Comamonas sp.]|nr:beta family protein [Comamonas sp.]
MKSPLYVPVVKGKLNDIIAIGLLSRRIRESVKPLIEAMPVNPKKPVVEEHVHRLCQYVRKHAPLGELFVDFYGLMPDARVPDGTNATLYGYQLLKGLGRYVTPVYGLEREDGLWEPLRDVVAGFGKGFAFRLRRDDLADDLIEETWSSVLERSAQLGVGEADIDLILDFASLSGLDLAEIKDMAISFLFGNPRAHHYRSIVIASSSALRTVSHIEKDDMAEVTRGELHLWADLWNDLPDKIRPVYGDYGIVHPDFSDIGPNNNINAKIRYTAGDKLLYFRGHGLKYPVKDYGQYRGLARKVQADPRYRGHTFSFGDEYLSNCARGLGTPGAPATWVKADMNHHVTYVAQQVDRLITTFASMPDATWEPGFLAEV